ncbi:DUF2218 domain-containing protein [Bradyrhizobium diazoefficiens]|nr:DUF2218 domain-containing protein [Bradyrhizobium diazoefficiens]QQN62316.1 DUF2218 domain-containing protein [Bradyrhizobium diazoefficiens]
MTVTTIGFVATAKSERYIQQLIKHWRHRLSITEADGVATIPFNPQVTLTLKASPAGIKMSLSVPDDAEDMRFRKVFESHLDRFAFREVPLGYAWTRQPG